MTSDQSYNHTIYSDIKKSHVEQIKRDRFDKTKFMINNMEHNKAFIHSTSALTDKAHNDKLLNQFKRNYSNYRRDWNAFPNEVIKKKITCQKFNDLNKPPLCLDIELAAVCDLACPHCFRQWVATPDKIMSTKLAYNLIDQAGKLNIPSIKFNWRGEPLLHPKLPEIIAYSKKVGILETIINTNAVTLDENTAFKLIKSGLDLIIYSFDGGSKESYEKMRPGRFGKNHFSTVYDNIVRFNKIKKKLNYKFPITKIQMVLTKETYREKDKFFKLFDNHVDDISVKQYSERGGKLEDLDEQSKKKLSKYNKPNIIFSRDLLGTLYVSEKRIACAQPLQRLLVTYDGRVSMCCYDWGSMHNIGYVDNLAIKTGDKEYKKILNNSKIKKKGFEMMKLSMPKKYNLPKKKISSLKEIWFGEDINKVREKHINNKVNQVAVCKSCQFKDTYHWKEIK